MTKDELLARMLTALEIAESFMAGFEDDDTQEEDTGLEKVRKVIAEAEMEGVEPALWFRNHYTCPDCKTEWTDEWSATCNDDCPNCGANEIEPHESDDIHLEDEAPLA